MSEHPTTDNHQFPVPDPGTLEGSWGTIINDELTSQLETGVEIRDTDANQGNYTPKTGAKYFSTDTGDIYVCTDGSTWTHLGTLGSGGGGDLTSVEGISTRRQHVGPLHQGEYHTGNATDSASGIVFTAADLHIESCVIDSDISSVSSPDETFELREYNGGAADPPIVDSVTVTLSGGPERIQLGFDVPASGNGDTNDEYVLNRGPTTDPVPMRRVDDVDWGTAEYDTHTYTDPPIDFLKGTAVMDSGDFGSTDFYYYFFDILTGAQADRTDSPWSTDVDEMYMRPRDPAEEHDVSPRSIWFDTSGT